MFSSRRLEKMRPKQKFRDGAAPLSKKVHREASWDLEDEITDEDWHETHSLLHEEQDHE